ncbi:hypothetical protein [Chryseobacterium gambrini]|uniref:hypothetical protein n=1 Tax=Chryseobacterium gambrini TaxID=373672 RepID=UPI0022F3A977|nr:hypothetical protein [Chryseobacterium gambrini]WBX98259.1 hypothetical protein PE065_03145 [Chryseobacterium gambrini]
MINDNKFEVLIKLSQIDDVVFVGGSSEFIQGIKKELNDIDISIKEISFLKNFGYVHKSFDDSFYGLSGQRGFIPLNSVLIDIFIDEKPQYKIFNGFKCQTLQSMISLRENTLVFNSHKLSERSKTKIDSNLQRLKLYELNNIQSANWQL